MTKPQHHFEFNQQLVHEYALLRILRPEHPRLRTLENEVLNLSFECPLEHGIAVLQARKWFTKQGIFYGDDCTPIVTVPRVREAKAETSVDGLSKTLRCYPNPTSGSIIIEGFENTDNEYTVIVQDLAGKTLLETSHAATGAVLELDLSSFPAGIYLCSIREGQQVVYTEKVVLQR